MSKVTKVEVLFTDQTLNEKGNVPCGVCDNELGLNSTAWFDSYNKTFSPHGCYVCYGCLSDRRMKEVLSIRKNLSN